MTMSSDKQRRPQEADPMAGERVPAHNPIGVPASGYAAQNQARPAPLVKAAYETSSLPAGVDYAKERGRR
jgi:hypothetical protein